MANAIYSSATLEDVIAPESLVVGRRPVSEQPTPCDGWRLPHLPCRHATTFITYIRRHITPDQFHTGFYLSPGSSTLYRRTRFAVQAPRYPRHPNPSSWRQPWQLFLQHCDVLQQERR